MRNRSGVRTLQITFTSNVPLEIKHALSLQHAFTPKADGPPPCAAELSGGAGAAASKRKKGEPAMCTRPFAGVKGAEGEGAQETGDWPRAPLLCSKPVPVFHELLPCLSTSRGSLLRNAAKILPSQCFPCESY